MARNSSIISPRNQGLVPGVPTPWQATWTPGPSLAHLFDLYPSKGDVTIAAPTSFPALLDGPIHVYRFGTLTVNTALIPPSVRCRGAFVLADNLVMGEAGSISMTARGAAGCSKWINQDIGIPTNIALSGKYTSKRAYLEWLAEHGYFIGDPTLYACPLPGMGDVQADYANWPARMAAIVSAAGCGAAANGANTAVGNTGGAGTNAPGGGGTGASNGYNSQSLPSAPGRVWGGGPGTGGSESIAANYASMLPDYYGGKGGDGDPVNDAGGGAGNPGGAGHGSTGVAGETGTGGVLFILVRGNVSLTTGHTFSSNGKNGGQGHLGGAGSGGGRVFLGYGGTLTGTPNMTATGGLAGATTNSRYAGAPGGAGAVTAATFAAMGWV